jgi:agmatine deiminase
MSLTLNITPRQDGFRMPGEFEPHVGCWMLWPERTDNWREGAKPAQRVFAAVAAAIARFEPVTMGVSRAQFLHARSLLPPQVRLVELSCNDSWMRDCGPTFVVDDRGTVRGVDWEFNAWGGLHSGLYFPWDQDALVAHKVLEVERLDRYRPGIVLEGGSIHVDGEGTLLTTEECLLHPNRNPDHTREQIEHTLREYLGIEQIIWLPSGVVNDETDGHIDNLCCFVRPGEVVLTWTDDRSDPQHERSAEAHEALSTARDARGRRLEVHKLAQPDPVRITEAESAGVDSIEGTLPRRPGDRMAASYVNFYIANGGIIAPTFDAPQDVAALAALARLFPDREVVGVAAREILLGGGNIHCIVQQQPLSNSHGEPRPTGAAGR